MKGWSGLPGSARGKVVIARDEVGICTGGGRLSTGGSRNRTKVFPPVGLVFLICGGCVCRADMVLKVVVWTRTVRRGVEEAAGNVPRLPLCMGDCRGKVRRDFVQRFRESGGLRCLSPAFVPAFQLPGGLGFFQLLDVVGHGVVYAYGHLSCHKGIDVVILERHL